MISIETYVKKCRLQSFFIRPAVQGVCRAAAYGSAGFVLSAASLMHSAMPLPISMLWTCRGWEAVSTAVGAILGYITFWGTGCHQQAVWILCTLAGVLMLGGRGICRETPLLQPALSALTVSACGVFYQYLAGDTTPIPVYLLRVAMAIGSCWVFVRDREGGSPVCRWMVQGFFVLALAQIMPIPYLGLGFLASGMLWVSGSFPAAALSGLALDLAQVTPVPMTAVAVLSFLIGLIPRMPLSRLAPGLVYISVLGISGFWDLIPLPGLILGGILGGFLPVTHRSTHRRGEVGVAQVRLEMASQVLTQTQQLLLEVPEIPVDEDALVRRAAERACSGCPCRKSCKDAERLLALPGILLHKPLLCAQELPILCRRAGRFLAELHRSQEQVRSIGADRQRQREYRAAVIQQYRFVSDFLRDLSEHLGRRNTGGIPVYVPNVQVYGNRPEGENGDRCLWFAGTMGKYYILLCDGMGTGMGAVQEGKTAADLLKKMLTAGYPAEYALRSLNSLCALRERAGAVTVDLAEVDLSSGRGSLYKWGAMPSYLVGGMGAQKLGSAGPPPGIWVTDIQEQREKFTLRRDQRLVLVSDGVSQEDAMQCCMGNLGRTGGELARAMLACGELRGQDDITVVTVELTAAVPQGHAGR